MAQVNQERRAVYAERARTYKASIDAVGKIYGKRGTSVGTDMPAGPSASGKIGSQGGTSGLSGGQAGLRRALM